MKKILLVLGVAAALTMAAGANAAPSIIGGEPASFANWPWQVAILNAYTADSYEAQFCGGTLIAPNVVLTAAHCLYDSDGNMADADDLDVLTGTSLLGGSFGDRSPVVGGVVSDGGEDYWRPDDLALLWVQHTSALAVPLPPATFAEAYAFRVGSRVAVAGWGCNRLNEDRSSFPHKLKQYIGTVREKSRGFLFIRSMKASGCFGDSGGPAVGRGVSGAPYLVGVVHGGRLDCALGQRAMFVNVAAQQRFIEEALARAPQPNAEPEDGDRWRTL
jgi:secreted trypsin-like serine protease